MIALVASHLAIASLLAAVTGGREIGDDAPHLLDLIRSPFSLFSDYRAAGQTDTWGSFPPLLPPVFGLLVRPWLATGSDFWAIRLGALCWSVLALLGFHRLARGALGIPRRRLASALWLFALSPSLIGASAVLPQEEAYVCLFGVLLYGAARQERWSLLPVAFVLTAMAGKYFLLVLAIPLAFASPRPLRELSRCILAPAVVLALYIAYHQLRFGLMPILEYQLNPAGAISAWALAWNLGFQPPAQIIQITSTLTTGSLVLVFCWLGRRRGFPLVFTVAGTLWIALLGISMAMPPYLLWNLPFLMLIFTMLERRPVRWAHAGLIYLWGGIAYAAKLLRGVDLALSMDRPAGKTIIGDWAVRVVGADFPFGEAHLVLRALLVAIGLGFLALLWMEGTRSTRGGASARCGGVAEAPPGRGATRDHV
jgi:hypothetical protein